MTGVAAVAAVAVILTAGTALGLLRRTQANARRIADLEAERDQIYEAQRILHRAKARKDRRHLHLLAVPAAWFAARLTSSSTARLAAASAVSAMVTGASVVSTDQATIHPPGYMPPAGAETTSTSVDEALGYVDSVLPAGTRPPVTVAGAPARPLTPATVGSVPTTTAPLSAGSSAPDPPTTTTTTSSTSMTTTTVVVDVPAVDVCVNPQGVPLPAEVCG